MLRGAVQELALGDPRALSTDVGPVIDADAQSAIEGHIRDLQSRGLKVWRAGMNDAAKLASSAGSFVEPTIIEIENIAQLEREVFGPVLHVLRYPRERLAQTLEQVNATGYGLTLGLHTRIDETIAQVVNAARAGNLYVNRNVVGAVVGVQPFGGEGLSGTGPKAGGPLYLLRLLARRPPQAARLAVAAVSSLTAVKTGAAGAVADSSSGRSESLPVRGIEERHSAEAAVAIAAFAALSAWARAQRQDRLLAHCDQAVAESPISAWRELPGPTGEANLYSVRPREAVVCLADTDADRLVQLASVLAVGSRAIWPAEASALYARLPAPVRAGIALAQDWQQTSVKFEAVLQHGSAPAILATAAVLARRPGPIVALVSLAPGETQVPLERLVVERSLSINTAAAGGNASLMTVG